MFRYIDMPKLVAFYLREFSYRKNGTPSNLYKFVFCLCLPFVSITFRRARLNALAIAECTNSADQIVRVLKKITGADMVVVPFYKEFFVVYSGDNDPQFPFNNSLGKDNPIVPYKTIPNAGRIEITLNGAKQSEVVAYLQLLIPFYIEANIIYK